MVSNDERCREYCENMDRLFGEWKKESGTVEKVIKDKQKVFTIDHLNQVFIRDGVVCPEKWFSQNIRPLFLLKEAYGGASDWDLISDHLSKPGAASGNMWRRIAEWTYGLQNSTKDKIAAYSSGICHDQFGNKYLKQIAVVNVKKSGGESTSDMDTIRAYADFDHDRLKMEIEYCDPTIIVCGYTGSVLDRIFGTAIRKPWNDNYYYFIEIKDHPVIILDYWHPANQYPAIMNYYSLMGIYHVALNEISSIK